MSAELEAVRAELAALRELVQPKPKKSHHSAGSAIANFRLSIEELAAVDAYADAKGISRAELMRQCLATVTGLVITVHHEIHPQFAKLHAKRKAARDRFKDGRTDTGQIERADASRAAARKITMLNLEASAIAREFGDARDARNVPGLLAETAKKF